MIIAVIKSTVYKAKYLIVKVLGLGSRDVTTGYNAQPFGIDSNVPAGYRGIFATTGSMADNVLIGIISEKAIADMGETRIYSEKADGSKSIDIFLKKDGTMEIGGNSDNLVKFSDLKTAMDNFKTSLTTQLTAALPTLVWSPANTEAVIMDITNSKCTHLKTNG